MAQNGMELPEGMRVPAKVSSEISTRVETEVPVLVVIDNTNLRDFTARVYDALSATVTIHGGTVRFTEDELLRYFVTAMKVRVEHTTLSRYRRDIRSSGLHVDEPWALPSNMAYVINAIGQVRYGAANTLVFPVWDKSADELVMTPQEQQKMTRELRAFATHGLQLASAIERSREGVVKVMILTYTNDTPEGEWVSPEPFAVVDALTASIAGLRPAVEYSNGNNPIWVPPYKVDGRTVVRYLTEAAEVTVKTR